MAHILVDTTVCVCWTELGQKLPWNKTVKIWKYLKVKVSVSVSVSVYLFARKKKNTYTYRHSIYYKNVIERLIGLKL